ncbi:MAG TPA: ribonuclease P protein component [Candidatus Dormibacteraeota bacterium]|jgi:ribonuclease P protein component|nr:ribonuclease P protein component [Candidatus Dormibacteraeota bacterium]
MKKKARLRRQRDFQEILSGARVYSGRTLVGFARTSETPGLRVGVAVSRKVGNAVRRNRARRRIREAVRTSLLDDWEGSVQGIGYEVVFIARPRALDEPMPALLRDIGAFVQRLPGSRSGDLR